MKNGLPRRNLSSLNPWAFLQHHIAEAYQTIRSALSLEPSDPRYLTEVGYMMMFSNLS